MKTIRAVAEMQRTSEDLRAQKKRIGVVPTMGFLHEGHASLIRTIRGDVDVVVTTIFVNPTQFGPNEDFSTYPRDIARDELTAQNAGTDILFCPESKEMYPNGFKTYVTTDVVSTVLEGKFRPTHFRGVTTVVAKLFNIVKPHDAIFGQKDIQQAFILRQMVRDLDFDIRIIIAPIVRESDGLAMSSRNVYLSADERIRATVLFRSLDLAEQSIQSGENATGPLRERMDSLIRLSNPTQIDYVAFLDSETFEETDEVLPRTLIALAVRFGSTRLLDNRIIERK